MKSLNLFVKVVGSLVLLAVLGTLLDNAYTYFAFGGLRGSMSSIMIAAAGYLSALALAGFLFVQLWKLKL